LKTNQFGTYSHPYYSVANPGCTQVSGPTLNLIEWRNGIVSGTTLPAGTKQVLSKTQFIQPHPPVHAQVFVVATNPVTSGSDEAGFLIDRINLLRDATSTSGKKYF
jgi:hypothetical protein